MTSMNKNSNFRSHILMNFLQQVKISMGCLLLLVTFNYATCKYSTKDTSPIPTEVKTFRVNYLENKARYVNPTITPQLTEKLKQKIIGQTRLRQTKTQWKTTIS